MATGGMDSKLSGGSSSNSGDIGEYDDMHRLVLQGMISAGMLDAEGVKTLFSSACSYLDLLKEERTSMSYVQKVMRNINDKIKPYDMAIRSACCELTGKKFYIFSITVEKPITKLQSMFTQFEVGLLQKVIDTIFRKYPSFTVPFTECINLASEVEARGNINQAEIFLHKMLAMNYLTKFPLEANDFNITMGIRGLRELEPVLRDCYSDCLENCTLCKTTMLHGLVCPDCHIAIHKYCYIRYLKNLKGVSAALCPSCNGSWENKSRMLVRMRGEEFFEYGGNATGQSPDDATPNPDMGRSPVDDEDDESIQMPTLSQMTKKESKQKPKTKTRRRVKQLSSEESD